MCCAARQVVGQEGVECGAEIVKALVKKMAGAGKDHGVRGCRETGEPGAHGIYRHDFIGIALHQQPRAVRHRQF